MSSLLPGLWHAHVLWCCVCLEVTKGPGRRVAPPAQVVLWPSRVSSCRVCARQQHHRDPRSRSAPQDRHPRRVGSPLLLCSQEQQLHLLFLRFLPALQIKEQFLNVWLINSSWLQERGSLAYFQLTLALADLRVNSETRKLT